MSVQVSRNSAVDVVPLKDETVLFQPQANRFCLLNVTASFLWHQLERPRTIHELADELCNCFEGVSREDAIRDVEATVSELGSVNCVVLSETNLP